MSRTDLQPRYSMPEIRDAGARGIAALVCDLTYEGKKGDEFGQGEIDEIRSLVAAAQAKPEDAAGKRRTQDAIAKLQKAGLGWDGIHRLPQQLESLETYLRDWGKFALARPPQHRFVSAINPDAVFAKDLKETINAVVESVGGDHHLTLGQYLRTKTFMKHVLERTELPANRTDNAKAQFAAFKAAFDDGRISEELFYSLQTMFDNERACLAACQQGPLFIKERKFVHVYRLERDGQDLSKMSRDELKKFILRRYEAEDCALNGFLYDRIYMIRNGELYVMFDEEGSVTKGKKKVFADAVVTTREDGNQEGVGVVVHRQEAVDTFREAVLKIISDLKNLITGDGPLKELLDAEKRLKKESTDRNDLAMAIKVIGGVAVGTPLVAAAKTFGLPIIAALALYFGGRNILNYVQSKRDPEMMYPIVNAIGMGVG